MKRNPFEKFLGPEDHLQHQIIMWLKFQRPKLKYHHSPDAGKRSVYERYKYKYLGSDSGFPDLIFPSIKLALELKVGKNTTTDAQDEWLEYFKSIGWTTGVCFTLEEAIETIKKSST